MPFCLRTEMKNLDKRRSSLLAGMFSIALDSFSDSQNFFHAFKSLLVLYWVFFLFLLLQKFLNFDFIFASSFFVRTQICQRLLVFFICPREGPLILPFSIINRNKPIFSHPLFVTFWGQLLQQDRSRCRSRWENLERGQDRFQPIKFLNLIVSSPFETRPYNNSY